MSLLSTPTLEPVVTLPVDDGLPGLPSLFDTKWVWREYRDQFGEPESPPERIRPQQIRYQPGRRALASYVVEWQWDKWVVEDQFAVELAAGKPQRMFRYPDDPYLPGLRRAASALEAHELLANHVLIAPRVLRVETVRYRPGTRAVLRYYARRGRAQGDQPSLFARVMPPKRVSRLLSATRLAKRSGFALPKLAGYWPEGGSVWLTTIPGETVRARIRKGDPPDPERILDRLAGLWSTAAKADEGQPLNLRGGYLITQRLLSQVLEGEEARRLLQLAMDTLGPFSESWEPSTLAHNDFYDDQVLITPQGQLALADYEEMGPGDPLLDVGNLLAHLRWMARFGISTEQCDSYRRGVRVAALDRFGWDSSELDMREAYAIFRLSGNPFRQLRSNWHQATETGLTMVAEVLDGAQ